VAVGEITSIQLLQGQEIREMAELVQQQGSRVAEAIAARHPLTLKMETPQQEVMAGAPQVVAVVQAEQALDIQELVQLIRLHKLQMVAQELSHV
jgi:plasmid maintenance system antidote protein VapI